MDNQIYYSTLYDYYKELLTDKQKQYFEEYYFDNLSLSEISENEQISRNAVHKQIKEVNSKLEDFELKLKIYEKNNKLNELIKYVDNDIKIKLEEIINLNN